MAFRHRPLAEFSDIELFDYSTEVMAAGRARRAAARAGPRTYVESSRENSELVMAILAEISRRKLAVS